MGGFWEYAGGSEDACSGRGGKVGRPGRKRYAAAGVCFGSLHCALEQEGRLEEFLRLDLSMLSLVNSCHDHVNTVNVSCFSVIFAWWCKVL